MANVVFLQKAMEILVAREIFIMPHLVPVVVFKWCVYKNLEMVLEFLREWQIRCLYSF